MFRFRDHKTAGQILGVMLDEYAERTGVVVLALRRSAIDVAQAVATALECPFVFEDPPVIPLALLRGATIILVDDGFASTDEVNDLISQTLVFHPSRMIAAAPVASPEAARKARDATDEAVFLATPSPFHSVGFWYEDTMREVAETLFIGSRRRRIVRHRAVAS
jgi:predicted phosphoribosyltransferase